MVAISVCESCKAGNHCYGSSDRGIDPSIYPGRPGGYLCICKCRNTRVELHQDEERGSVLEIAFIGRESDRRPFSGAAFVEEEITRRTPQLLIINLLEFEASFGNALVGALVRATQAMKGAVRIIARDDTTRRLQQAFAVMKLESLFEKRIFSDRESALRQ